MTCLVELCLGRVSWPRARCRKGKNLGFVVVDRVSALWERKGDRGDGQSFGKGRKWEMIRWD
jgi:hypothetical protein